MDKCRNGCSTPNNADTDEYGVDVVLKAFDIVGYKPLNFIMDRHMVDVMKPLVACRLSPVALQKMVISNRSKRG